MAFQVSPGVAVAEVDLTTRVPIPSISTGGFAGAFRWGPTEEVVTITDENQLVDVFGKPDGNTYQSFFTAANFLAYSNALRVVRAANTSNALNAVTSGGTAVYIQNDRKYKNTYESTTTSGSTFFAKYPGSLGNTLKTSICLADRANTEVTSDGVVKITAVSSITLTGTFDSSAGSNVFTVTDGSSSNVDFELRVGDVIDYSGTKGIVTQVTNSTSFIAIQGNDTDISADSISAGSITRLKRSAFEEPATNMLGTIAISAGGTTVNGTDTKFDLQVAVGDILTFTDDVGTSIRRKVSNVSTNTTLTLSSKVDNSVGSELGASFSREWEFRSDFAQPPLTSPYAYKRSGNKDVNDEIHVIVVDEDGLITGTKDVRGGTPGQVKSVLEAYPNLSVANGAVAETGVSIYYKDYINNNSKWIWWGDHNSVGDTVTLNSVAINDAWGDTITQGNTTFQYQGAFSSTSFANGIVTLSFTGGDDGTGVGDADYIKAYSYLREPEKVDISLLMTGEASNTVAIYVINQIAEYRKDCVAFVSPQQVDVVNKEGNEVTNIIARRNQLPSTSYAVMDGNYKYMFDRYNAVYRYVPFNGDVAGLCAQADSLTPFISPAGFNRGNLKGVDKLAFNPAQAERDDLYINGVNPIVGFPGRGRVLFGDKTLLAKPSAFDRINVRRLFIALEKAIANAAQFSLFEFNDPFTRSNFVALVEPFLREVQSSRAIQDFKVVCDESNNTPAVIDSNQFRGDIFIKPARSINFIQLNFVAVASGVEFSEVAGAI